jgi:hypothetical protein
MSYENSKIYKLQSNDGYYYIGSTILDLNIRLSTHKTSSKHRDYKVYKHFENKWDTVEIILIETYKCNSYTELRIREDEYIKKEIINPYCLNTIRAYNTKEDRKLQLKEYYNKNKEQKIEYCKEYYIKNKEKIDEYRHQYAQQYREQNIDKIKEYAKQYRQQNKEKTKEYNRQYRLMRKI